MVSLPALQIDPIVRRALQEDWDWGDWTTEAIIPPGKLGRAQGLAKAPGIVAGLPIAQRAFQLVDPVVEFLPRSDEGDSVTVGQVLFEVNGSLQSILTAERVALNFLQHLSGIATLTGAFAEAIRHTKARLLDTRKTTPGLRLLEKYAVRVGGGLNHRYSLSDAILIKDNHIAAAGSIQEALERVRPYRSPLLKVEVECTNLDQVREALRAGCDLIMLDNMAPETLSEAVREVNGCLPLEASGNVRPETVVRIAETGVDYISCGAITHSAPALDISLEVLSP